MGAEDILKHLEQKLGIKKGQTTPDGKFTLKTVECLGSCGTAPMMDDWGGLPREPDAGEGGCDCGGVGWEGGKESVLLISIFEMEKNTSWIKSLWKDPVWSKVIAAGIIAAISFMYVSISSYYEDITLGEAFTNFINRGVRVKYLLILTGLTLVILVLSKVFKKNQKKSKIIYSDEHKELDKKTLLRTKEMLPSNGAISFIRVNNFAGFSFDNERIDELFRFDYCGNDPEFEFIDSELNQRLEKLKESIAKFVELICLNTFPVRIPGRNANTVPPEWEIEQPDRFIKVVREIHSTTHTICKEYDELVKMGKRKLGI